VSEEAMARLLPGGICGCPLRCSAMAIKSAPRKDLPLTGDDADALGADFERGRSMPTPDNRGATGRGHAPLDDGTRR
jgi:hypothetical protein